MNIEAKELSKIYGNGERRVIALDKDDLDKVSFFVIRTIMFFVFIAALPAAKYVAEVSPLRLICQVRIQRLSVRIANLKQSAILRFIMLG